MKSSISKALFVAGLTSLVSSLPVTTSDLLSSYDYVVIGGGPGGMTTANRLSEDSSSTFRCLTHRSGQAEAGG